MKTAPIVGIDLGTTNSAIAYVDDVGNAQTIAGRDGHRIIPSVVFFQGPADFVVGAMARDQALVEPARVAQLFKRGMGGKTFLDSNEPFSVDGKVWSPEELSSLVLKKLISMATEFFQAEVTRAVITVPAYFGEAERAATKTAGELAGLEVLALPNEPMAAAASHGLTRDAGTGLILVFDLGGGTFDVTVLERSGSSELVVKSHQGDRRLGGADFDRMIFDRMVQAVREQSGGDLRSDPYDFAEAMSKAEEIKKQLSTSTEVRQLIQAAGSRNRFELSRVEFEELLEEKLEEVSDTIDIALEESGVTASDVNAVLLVGGSSRIPAFQKLLRQKFSGDLTFSKNLDEDVARGAALLGTLKAGEAPKGSFLAQLPPPRDVASHSIGVTIQGPTGEMRNAPVLLAGTAVPTQAPISQEFFTVEDGQTSVDVRVNEGHFEDLSLVRNLGKGTAAFGSARPKGYPITITMEYSADQLLVVKAYDGKSKALMCELPIRHEGLLNGNQKERAMDFMRSIDVD
jgi:molecular chaperone DnaK